MARCEILFERHEPKESEICLPDRGEVSGHRMEHRIAEGICRGHTHAHTHVEKHSSRIRGRSEPRSAEENR